MNRNSQFEKFTGVYCSGFFIPEPSMLTTLCLLFDNIYIPNNLEYLLEFVKKYKCNIKNFSILEKANGLILTPYEDCFDNTSVNPFQDLSESELKTAKVYLFHAMHFFVENRKLIGEVIKTTMLPDDEVFEVELINKGMPGERNTYKVSGKPLIVSLEGVQQFDELINNGAIPVLGKYHVDAHTRPPNEIPSKELACLLAMKSISLVLPAMKSAHPEIILEARDKLRDHLPVFWSSMLKLSGELKSKIKNTATEKDVFFETQEIVDTIVLPAIIELKQKLEMERKNWFHKILHPVFDGVKIFMGNPQLSTVNLASIGLSTGLNIANSFVSHTESVNRVKTEAGLTYLLRLDEMISR